jgi:predicted RNase H-like HicB family nuclease
MQLVVRIADSTGGMYRAWCPALPGCAIYGNSRNEAQARIQQAVQGYVEHMDVALPRELARQRRLASRTTRARAKQALRAQERVERGTRPTLFTAFAGLPVPGPSPFATPE